MGYTHMYTHMSATDIYTYVFIDMCVYTQNR